MAKFTFHMGVDIRAYGNVEAEADTVDDAVKLLTTDYVVEHIEPGETTWDTVSNLSIINAHEGGGDDAYFDENTLIEEWSGVDLLPPEPAQPSAGQTTATAEFMQRYNAELDRQEIAPNGDDFNAICNGVAAILAGGPAPAIAITPKGR